MRSGRARTTIVAMLTTMGLFVLVFALWVGGGMILRPEEYLRAKRERAPFFRALASRLNQPTTVNLWTTRITGATIVAFGVFATSILLSH